MLARAPILTPSALLMRRRRSLPALANSATDWYFAQFGLAGTPWADVSRTGLGTRVDSAGLVQFGPHNLASPATDFTHANYQKILGVTVGAGGSVTFPGVANAERIDFNSGLAVSTQAVWSATFRLRGSGVIRIALAGSSGGEIETLITLTGTDTDYTVTGNAAAVATGNMVARLIRRSSEPAPTGVVWSSLQFNAGPPQAFVPNTTTTARYLPRITHDPATLSALGLLVEGQATNLVSTNLANWTPSEVTRNYNAGVAPDGTNTAVKLVPSAVSGIHQLTYPTFTGVNGNSYTYRWFIKAAEYSRVAVWANGESKGLYINATTGAITNQTAGVTVLENFLRADGWRVLTLTFTQTVVNAVPALYCVDNSGSISFAGNGANGVLVWEPDYVVGTVPSSHIPNPGTGSAVRVADDWFLSGAAFNAAIDPSVGTFFVEFFWAPGPPVGGVFSISNDTNSNRIDYRAGQSYVEIAVGGVVLAGINSGMTPQTGWNRIAVAWSAAGYAISLNGGAPVTGTANCSGLAATQLQLGNINPRTNTTFHLGYPIRTARSFRGQYITGPALQAITA